MGILVGAMSVKTVLSSNSNGTVVVRNGPAPLPIPH